MNGAPPVYVRRDIWSLQPDDPIVTAYAAAVKTMRERPEDKPTSWTYQAAMHGTYEEPDKRLWNECQHGTWYFLPWHRMFLYYFERIVRAAVIENGGPADWALPYWNYGLGGDHAKLPIAFREPTLANGDENPLFAERADGMNSGNGGLPGWAASPKEALERPAFIGKAEFGGDRTRPTHHAKGGGGELEQTPHNVVHGLVGGEQGVMRDPQTAATDPIFWLHHSNIDRIWSEWIGVPGAGHEDPSEAPWRAHSFSFFDEAGATAALRCDGVLATIADLGYTYDTEPPPPVAPAPVAPSDAAVNPPEKEMIGATDQETVLTGEAVTVSVAIDERAAQHFDSQVHAYLNVEEVKGESNPGTGYAVYANLQPDESIDAQSSRHVGNLSFFGIERSGDPAGDQPPHALGSSYEITAIARELDERGEWAGHELRVTFEPLSLVPGEGVAHHEVESASHPERPVRLGRLSVFYDA